GGLHVAVGVARAVGRRLQQRDRADAAGAARFDPDAAADRASGRRRQRRPAAGEPAPRRRRHRAPPRRRRPRHRREVGFLRRGPATENAAGSSPRSGQPWPPPFGPTTLTSVVGSPNSASTWRQAPQGGAAGSATTATARIRFAPAATAAATALRSAQ